MWENGQKNQKKVDDVSSIIVSVLQAGAFFGALGSAPVSGKCSECHYTCLGLSD